MRPDAFLNAFFGERNLIGRAQVETTDALRDLVRDITPDLRSPAVLPRRTSPDEVEWYVMCGDDAAFRRLQAEVQGFVGPSYGRWDGNRAVLDLSDPVECAVSEFTGGRALRFRTASNAEFRECWGALDLMRSVWRQRPAQELERVRTGPSLVREFELAISAGDVETARERVAELRRRGLIGTENLRFLEIRTLAAQGRWREIAEAPDLGDLARIRRPWLVTEDLLIALYRVHLASFEAASDVPSALNGTLRLVDALPDLFTTRGPLRSGDVAKAFALRFALPGREDKDRIDELLVLPGLATDDRAWISAIADAIAPPSRPTRSASQALADGDVDAAFQLALDEPASPRRTELFVECAFELRTLESAQAATEALDELSDADRTALLDRRLIAVAVNEVRALVEPAPKHVQAAPGTWTAWFHRLLNDPAWQASDAVAACGELEYSATDIVDPASAAELASLMLNAADSDRRQAFRDALPRIVGWLERQELDPTVTRPVHVAILTVLALDSAWGEASLEVAYNSSETLLRAGLDEGGYDELLEQLDLLWERMGARVHAAWLADLLELLELHPGPRDQLVSFVATAAGRALAFADRLDQAIVGALARSCTALGAGDLGAALEARVEEREAAPESSPHVLKDKTVGIYTLTPQVAVRARDAIERRFPGVRVQVDSSLASTSALEHLAATADYLIVSIRSAKHAATDAIERHRPRDLPTLVPRGRGSSRMVEALVAAVASAE